MLSAAAAHNTRTPGGHPEGFLEAFANLYRNFALTLSAELEGVKPETEWLDYPSVDDGVTGLQFIEAVVRSSTENAAWIKHPFEN